MYSEFFAHEITKALNGYYLFAKTNKKDCEICEKYSKTQHYLLLLNHLASLEKARNQKNNIFMDMWKHNCFIRIKHDLYEALAVGWLTEQEGNREYAKEIFDTLVEEHPINKDAIKERENFYKRNPDMTK